MMKSKSFAARKSGDDGLRPELFDIVNGFLIDAATRGFRSSQGIGGISCVANLAEIIVRTYMLHQFSDLRLCLRSDRCTDPAQSLCKAVVDGVDSQA